MTLSEAMVLACSDFFSFKNPEVGSFVRPSLKKCAFYRNVRKKTIMFRCSDRTECGSYISAVKCLECNIGIE
jgi:hypothetical protein